MGLVSIEVYKSGKLAGQFKEASVGLWHEYSNGAPCDWSAERGATHTFYTYDGTRPAKILKTVAYIGVDESNDDIVWEKWKISNHSQYDVKTE